MSVDRFNDLGKFADHLDFPDDFQDRAEKKGNGWYSVKTKEKNHKKGYFRLNDDGSIYGGNHKTQEKGLYVPDGIDNLSPEEAEKKKKAAEAKRAKEKADLEKKRFEIAMKAHDLYRRSRPLETHPYLTKKEIRPAVTMRTVKGSAFRAVFGYLSKPLKDEDDLILIPMKTGDQLVSLQLISPQGNKFFISDSKKEGTYWTSSPIPEKSDEPYSFVIGEGVATVLSVIQHSHDAEFPMVGVATMDAGNFPKVVRELCTRYTSPLTEFILAADNDVKLATNPGKAAAEESMNYLKHQCRRREWLGAKNKKGDPIGLVFTDSQIEAWRDLTGKTQDDFPSDWNDFYFLVSHGVIKNA